VHNEKFSNISDCVNLCAHSLKGPGNRSLSCLDRTMSSPPKIICRHLLVPRKISYVATKDEKVVSRHSLFDSSPDNRVILWLRGCRVLLHESASCRIWKRFSIELCVHFHGKIEIAHSDCYILRLTDLG